MALLDIELISERVRSDQAKSFIKEAVICYKAGAYRSCIVSTWVALVHDFLEKFRELALSGDASAKTLVAEFDRIQAARDTAAALKFEREVLDVASNEYELISAQEKVELKRLLEDRNRFAHPNINQDAEALDATPELARAHLRAAVEHVMQRPPVQGKVALSTIRASVESPYFPKDVTDAMTALSATPLVRAKINVVRDFFLGSITSLLREDLDLSSYERYLAASQAAQKMYPAVVDGVIASKLGLIFNKTSDDFLDRLIVLLYMDPDLIRCVSEALTLRLKSRVKMLENKNLSVLNFAGEIEFLVQNVVDRLSTVTAFQMRDFVQQAVATPAPVVVNRAIEILEKSTSWDSSNAIISVISERMIDILSKEQALILLKSNSNSEVKWAFTFPGLIKKLVTKGLLKEAEVKEVAALDSDSPLNNQ
ncbi:hypothetical protein VDF76_19590 [Xanthomonas campestris pv. raphani]|uniref:hypothetical protein n=1 Tax=Xanthomonas campestris TaxID=339 RepID=UPI002B23D5C0|nr:hypothetical protein [Xanthomonas campestris]MEA9749152.1 hypothetical protein [Xanthomonas campestris pv. raphani]MEA9849864.1 hypothetical protein [Xanthomonas campestris pv. raphani]MEA9931025.1 hypothetical protein [Xanthomonas campestris pv. raphani]